MKVLLSCVGSSDPYGKEVPSGLRTEGPLLSTIRDLSPDRVLLFPTGGPDGTSARIEGIRTALSQSEFGIEVYEFTPKNPARIEDVLPSLLDVVRTAVETEKRACHDTMELHVAVASGTTAMTQAWMVLFSLGLLPNARLWQSLDPTKIESSEQRIVPVRIDIVQRPAVLDALESYADGHLYARAYREIARFGKTAAPGTTAEAIILMGDVFEAWMSWDVMEYGDARLRLKNLTDEIQKYPVLSPLSTLVTQQCGAADRLLEAPPAEREREQILNLAFLAKRCNTRGELIASLAISRRIYEECLFRRAQSQKTDISNCPGLPSIRQKLIDEGDREMAEFKSRHTNMDDVFERRNDSVAGHGMAPVTQDLVVRGLNMVNATLTELLGVDQAVLESHPFAPKVMRAAVKETLRRIRSEPV